MTNSKSSKPQFYSQKSEEELLKLEKRESLTTGIEKIDRVFGFPSGYYIICANPGAGKGFFALWLIRKFFENNEKQAVYFSLEMPESLVRERILQQWSDLTKDDFDNGASVDRAVKLLQQDAITVDEFFTEDTSKQTPENFYRKIDFYYDLGYRVFHFDHLHELEGANDNNRNQQVTERWAKTFQQICKEYPDIWLFIYAQPNGAAASKVILKRTDIAGSKAITQKCEFYLSLNRQTHENDFGQINVDESDRNVILWLDKTRVTSESHIGFRLHFAETGNFFETLGEEL